MRMHMKNKLVILGLAAVGFCCATLKSIDLFPESKDIELGLQVDQQIRNDPKQYPLLTDRPAVKTYVEQVGKKDLKFA